MELDPCSRGNLIPLFEEHLHITASAHLLDTGVGEQMYAVVAKADSETTAYRCYHQNENYSIIDVQACLVDIYHLLHSSLQSHQRQLRIRRVREDSKVDYDR